MVLSVTWLHVVALAFVAAFQVAVILCWQHCSPWIPRPPEGYVWEHSLDEWAQISAQAREPKKQWVYSWVNRYDPKTGRRWEEQEWIIEPF